MTTDTIVAQATAPAGWRRHSPRLRSRRRTGRRDSARQAPQVRYAEYLPFRDEQGQPLDQGIALLFKAPNSFTGEDVLELQGHGGPVIMDMLVRRILQIKGLRPARPGEFSERAFMNDKLDLAQAEAIADLIEASSEQAARSAMHSCRGSSPARSSSWWRASPGCVSMWRPPSTSRTRRSIFSPTARWRAISTPSWRSSMTYAGKPSRAPCCGKG